MRLRRDTSGDKIHQMLKSRPFRRLRMQLPSQLRDQAGTTETRSAAAMRPAEYPAEQPPPDALLVEMRTRDDLGQSGHNVLYGEADGDVEAALGSGTSLALQQHDETGVSDNDNDNDTLRKVQHLSTKAWPYKQECRGHDSAKKNLLR